ncbi:MAG: hypothetical protein J6A79_01500 [Clostridia bacterium]|nr:hypothetical protein [Clostridia bacterium]
MNTNAAAYELQGVYRNTDQVEKNIMDYALLASLSNIALSFIPGVSTAALVTGSIGFTVALYASLCKLMEIHLSENTLRILASAAFSNLTANLTSALILSLVASFIPGLSNISGPVIAFAAVYLAGNMFVKLLSIYAREGQRVDEMSEEEIHKTMEEIRISKEEARNAIRIGTEQIKANRT